MIERERDRGGEIERFKKKKKRKGSHPREKEGEPGHENQTTLCTLKLQSPNIETVAVHSTSGSMMTSLRYYFAVENEAFISSAPGNFSSFKWNLTNSF